MKILPGSDQRELDELIDTASLSLYLLGRLDTFKFPYQTVGHTGTGLLAFYFITIIFSAEYHYGNWRNTSLQAGWLRIFPLGDVLKFIESDLDRAPWLTQTDKDFLLGLTANALPELTDSIQQDPDQTDLRLRRQASFNIFLAGQGYSVENRAEFIELAAERAMAEALQLLRDLSGLEDPAAQVTVWKAEMQGIESEEQFRKIGWQWVEHGCFLWALDRLGKVPKENELIDSMDSFAAYVILGGEAERNDDEFMFDLLSSHKTRSLELRQGLFRIMNLCETRDMIYLLGMDIMNAFDSSQEDSQAGIWIKKWRLIPLTMRNEALRKSRKKMDDDQKEDPYGLALEEKRRRVHSGI